jgi:UDP:flavonoid glycosyltransferase YjiC (YdhE family)
VAEIAQRVLLLPLSNVLGHLARAFALAEEFDRRGHRVFLAMDRTYRRLARTLPPGIQVLPTPEMFPVGIRPALVTYEDGREHDLANLERAGRMSATEKRRRGERLRAMIASDAALIAEVRPDVIVTDQRFTASLLSPPPNVPVFHFSNLVGYASVIRRTSSELPFPLNTGRIVVPGVRAFEGTIRPARDAVRRPRPAYCGVIRWRGWERLASGAPPPLASDVLLSFGSTGNGRQVVPALLHRLPKTYRVSVLFAGASPRPARRNVHVARSGNLGDLVARTNVVICHGGHGTVMECLHHRRPVIVVPQNVEQLEIGRRIEQLGLGILLRKPVDQLTAAELGDAIEIARRSRCFRTNLAKFSALVRRGDGAKAAVTLILRALRD